jgi:predicted permease
LGFQVVEVVARLRPDVSVEAVSAELDVLVERALAGAQRRLFDGTVVTRVVPPSDRLGAGTREALLVLLGAVALLLLVACSNVANLLLARGAGRARELALKMALGAGTGRLVRGLLAECLMLALAAGLAGLAFGWLTLRVVMALRPSSLPALADLTLDPVVLAFTFGVSALTALLFGLAPALQLRSAKVGDALRHGASGVVRGGGGARVRKLLVAAQMAISVVLLVSAGLVVRSVVHLQSIDVGFDTENLLTARLALPRAKYESSTSREVLAEQLIERIETLSGVADVTQAQVAPPNGVWSLSTEVEARGSPPSDASANVTHGFNHVRPNFFDVLGIPLQGRTFAADEVRGGRVVIVNRAAAERYWPGGNAIGAQMRWGEPEWRTVVGVAGNVIAGGLTRPSDEPQFYFPFDVERVPMTFGAPPTVTLMVRAADDAADVIAAVRAATQALDPEIAITNMLLTETAFAGTIDAPRFNMALLTAFAVLALVLAAVGLAAVIGYEITERTHEIGIRMALGARTENVRRLAMRQGLTPAFAGVVIGVLGALGATQLAASLLYGVTPRDPLTFAAVVALLVGVALGASWLPARRATRVEPIIALRAD